MDYPLNKEELKEVEFCIEEINTDLFDLSTYMLEPAHHYVFEFLIRYDYLQVTDSNGNAITNPQRWITEKVHASFSSPKDKLIDEIRTCNDKAKAPINRNLAIGITSSIISLLTLIATLIGLFR